MAKDFAFLFYVNDWAGGTQWMSRIQRGAYLDLLLYQVNNTCFSLEEVKSILGDDFDKCWGVLERKFAQENGNYYNKKMREVLETRARFTESRRENRLGKIKKQVKNTRKSLVKQVGNENERVNEIELLRLEIVKNLSNNGKTQEEIETIATSTVEEDFAQFSRLTEWIEKNTPRVADMKEPITLRQFVKIREEIKDKAKITELLKNMQNWQPLLKKNVSAYQTLLNWSKRGN